MCIKCLLLTAGGALSVGAASEKGRHYIRRTLSRRAFLRSAGLGLAGTAVLTAACSQTEQAAQDVHWSYEGEEGPANWGNLSSEYTICGIGEGQSPVDITQVASGEGMEEIIFNYSSTPLIAFNNGHTIQVNYTPGSSMTYGGKMYALLQFHFHNPSEHTLDGRVFPMELHLVHRNDEGNIAVVGVWLEEGQENPFLWRLWRQLPHEGEESNLATTLDASNLLPEDKGYYTYTGSLTTPPCSEGVRWLMMKNPLQMSPQQIASYGALLANTARPVQPLNNRTILGS
jgi:carbonic anhydrase